MAKIDDVLGAMEDLRAKTDSYAQKSARELLEQNWKYNTESGQKPSAMWGLFKGADLVTWSTSKSAIEKKREAQWSPHEYEVKKVKPY